MSTKLFFHNAFVKRQSFSLKQGSRPWNAFIIVCSGSFVFTMNGEEFTVRENEVAFFPQDVTFERSIVEPITFHQFGFHVYSDENDIFLPSPNCGKLNISHECVANIIRVLDRINKKPFQGKKRIYHHYVDTLLMLHYISTKEKTESTPTDKDVSALIEYMYDHLDEKININEIAKSLHLTHNGLIKKFKRAYGCTPNEHLIKMRINLAKRLIGEGQFRINEIATLCGYSNAYYFSNAFHKCTGMSPSKYRDSLKI